MASITLDLQDVTALMAMFAQGSRPTEAMTLYNAARTKAGKPTASGPDNVVVSPTGYDQAENTSEGTTVANVLAAIQAAT
ncbi:hypothetical protein [Streptomyces sp. OP7]|uniref:hypothetical protein n=1 Tax=Streptomyces sp. OP7 TaxID=3142462 RepID=UPI0032E91C7B